MTRYSITRKRNNKKYKKSPKVRGKGRRSIMRCKTRKPKGFKKAKRYTVGKRRRMVGGVVGDDYNFFINTEMLTKYIQKEYGRSFGSSLRLELKGFGYAFITKLTSFSEENRYEKMAVYSCSVNGIIKYYAIVRCDELGCPVRGQELTYGGIMIFDDTDSKTPRYIAAPDTPDSQKSTYIAKSGSTGSTGLSEYVVIAKPGSTGSTGSIGLAEPVVIATKDYTGSKTPNLNMESKILFVTKNSVSKVTEPFSGSVALTSPCYKFTNSISTTDKYRIFVDTRYDNKLTPVFEKLSNKEDPTETVTFDIAKRIKSNTDYYIMSQQPEKSASGVGLATIIAESL